MITTQKLSSVLNKAGFVASKKISTSVKGYYVHTSGFNIERIKIANPDFIGRKFQDRMIKTDKVRIFCRDISQDGVRQVLYKAGITSDIDGPYLVISDVSY